jgi:hypothetical protein
MKYTVKKIDHNFYGVYWGDYLEATFRDRKAAASYKNHLNYVLELVECKIQKKH